MNTDSGAPPQNSELVAESLREALRTWEERQDQAELRRAVLGLLLRLER